MTPAIPSCPFCAAVTAGAGIASNAYGIALFDRFPVSPGHVLVVPRRHAGTIFDLDPAEQAALWALVPEVKVLVDRLHTPDGYNVGTNAGRAAGQTVMHAHIHVIPRYAGDVEDPRGGVRWVVPPKARYWTDT